MNNNQLFSDLTPAAQENISGGSFNWNTFGRFSGRLDISSGSFSSANPHERYGSSGNTSAGGLGLPNGHVVGGFVSTSSTSYSHGNASSYGGATGNLHISVRGNTRRRRRKH